MKLKELTEAFAKHPLDKKLESMGWEETYGIGLYAHPDYGTIMVDTNADWPAAIYPDSKGHHESYIGFADKPEDIDKKIEKWIKDYDMVHSPARIKKLGKRWIKFADKMKGEYDD